MMREEKEHCSYLFDSTMAICSLKTVLFAALTLLLLERSRGFVVFHSCNHFHSSSTPLLPLLYNDNDNDSDPVPRFVANNNDNNNKDDNDHYTYLTNMSRLFLV
jgi:hypothetical protein